MYFSRIRAEPGSAALLRDLAEKGDGLIGDHEIMWQFFSDRSDRQRDFLFHRVLGRSISYYSVSARQPIERDGWITETREFEPRLAKGNELEFLLRASPVVRRRDPDGRQRRHDVVMDAKRSEEQPSSPELWQEAGGRWLGDRADKHGFEVVALGADRYLQHRSRRHEVRFSTLDLSGVLRVSDPQRFGRLLIEGLGPQKAFGCGMVLVKRH